MAALPLCPAQSRPLDACCGEILREAVHADRPLPPFSRVTMDGIAVAWADAQSGLRRYRVQGTAFAGEPRKSLEAPGHCLEVMTGAVAPAGAGLVIPVEQVVVKDGWAEIAADAPLKQNAFIHPEGSDRAADAELIPSGVRLKPPHIAIAASVGLDRLMVTRRPVIQVITSGDELIPIEQVPEPHQIRRSNGPALLAALQQAGYRDVVLHHEPDDRAILRERIAAALVSADLLVLTGGVSRGKSDFIPEILTGLGVREVFHRVAQRPGGPMWFGCSPEGKPVFGLPGNPVSCLVGLYRYVLPALQTMLGASRTEPRGLVMEKPVDPDPVLTLFIPVRIHAGRAARIPMNTSGDFSALSASDGFIELQPGPSHPAADTPFPFYSWHQEEP